MAQRGKEPAAGKYRGYLEDAAEGNVVHKHVGKQHLRVQTAVRSGKIWHEFQGQEEEQMFVTMEGRIHSYPCPLFLPLKA